MTAELYACLYAREFPAQALLRLRPELREQPCVVMEGDAPLEQICSLNAQARLLGMARGMTRVEVETFPAAAVLARSLEEEAATRAIQLECAGGFSPRVEELGEGVAFATAGSTLPAREACSGRRRRWRGSWWSGRAPWALRAARR